MTISNSTITNGKFYKEGEIKATERIQVKPSLELSELCHLSKNLYNLANYLIRHRFFFMQAPERIDYKWLKEVKWNFISNPGTFDSIAAITQRYINFKNKQIEKMNNASGKQGYAGIAKWMNYNEVWRLVQYTEDYKALGAHSAQGILKQLLSDWEGFFEALKEYRKDKKDMTPFNFKTKWKTYPRIPGYKDKNGETIAFFSNQQCEIKDGYLTFPGKTKSPKSPRWLPPVKTRYSGKFQLIRVIPKGAAYIIEIVYNKTIDDYHLNKDNMCTIDLGVRNIVTMANNIGKQPIVVKGGIVKSINQFYNKERARLMSIKDKQKNKCWTKKLHKLDLTRYNKMEDKFHKLSKNLVRYWINNDIGTVVIGYNQQWKQKSNIGKKNNQNFVGIPFWSLIKKIMYKAYLVGIDVYLETEPYTSKCSFLDNETIEKHDTYLGKRISRGLFRASDGRIINADVNAAFNIMRKAFPKAISADGIEDLVLHPQRVSWF
jgi:putative transposase